FQTAITSPRLFAFEEEGGILPLHNVGLTVSGKLPSGGFGLRYTAEIGNSATWASTNATPTSVLDRHAVNFALASHPRAIGGLEIGASGYRDRFQPFAGLDLYRSVWSAHIVYNANRFEFLNEGVVSNIRYNPSHATGILSGFYSQLGYRTGAAWGPYVRVEKLTVHGSPFFDSLSDVVPWRSLYTAGIRYDWKESVA